MNTTTPQNDYLAACARQVAAIRAPGRQIAEALTISTGEVWMHCPPEDAHDSLYTEIHGPAQQVLHIQRGQPGRLEIAGSFGDARDYADRDERHAITVSVARRPVEIARAILRRLVPGYLRSLTAARAAKESWEAKTAQQTALAAALCGEVQGRYLHQSDHRFYVHSPVGHPDRLTCAEINVLTDQSIWMDLNGLTADQARAILAIVLGWPTAAPADQADQPAAQTEAPARS